MKRMSSMQNQCAITKTRFSKRWWDEAPFRIFSIANGTRISGSLSQLFNAYERVIDPKRLVPPLDERFGAPVRVLVLLKIHDLLSQKYELLKQDIIKVQRSGIFVTLDKSASARMVYRNPSNGKYLRSITTHFLKATEALRSARSRIMC